MVPCGKFAYARAPGATVSICEPAPGRLTVTLAAVPPGLRTWMLSLNMPAEALSYQFTKLVVAAWVAICDQTSLKVWWNWTLCDASTVWSGVIVIGTQNELLGRAAG